MKSLDSCLESLNSVLVVEHEDIWNRDRPGVSITAHVVAI